jgi:simple sugar transport system ATP-binding protein
VTELCDSATVLRDGAVLWSRSGEDIREDDLVEALLGGQERQRARAAAAQESVAPPVLSVSGATDAGGAFGEVSFEVGPGEMVAIGGIGGSGKYTVGEALAGLAKLSAGAITVGGVAIGTGGVPAAQAAGIGYVPADRHKDGYVPQLSVAENMTMSVMPRLATRGWFRPSRQMERARTLVEEVGLVPADPKLAVSGLSGGNQQKVVLARALALEPRVLVLVSPTAGVDIAAKNAIYALMVRALKEGVAVVMISDDIEELLICPRVLIMRHGAIASELHNPDEESIVRAIEGMENLP